MNQHKSSTPTHKSLIVQPEIAFTKVSEQKWLDIYINNKYWNPSLAFHLIIISYIGQETMSSDVVKEKFSLLAQTHFIQRCSGVEEDGTSASTSQLAPTLAIPDEQLYLVPDIDS